MTYEKLVAAGYTHYQVTYWAYWGNETYKGGSYALNPEKFLARHLQDNFEDCGDFHSIRFTGANLVPLTI